MEVKEERKDESDHDEDKKIRRYRYDWFLYYGSGGGRGKKDERDYDKDKKIQMIVSCIAMFNRSFWFAMSSPLRPMVMLFCRSFCYCCCCYCCCCCCDCRRRWCLDRLCLWAAVLAFISSNPEKVNFPFLSSSSSPPPPLCLSVSVCLSVCLSLSLLPLSRFFFLLFFFFSSFFKLVCSSRLGMCSTTTKKKKKKKKKRVN